MSDKTFRLCYVEGHFAYFTTQPLDQQWGDDWDDAPYEHNADEPYCPYNGRGFNEDGTPKWEIVKVAFDGPFDAPCDRCLGCSPWSVEQINAGAVDWLVSQEHAKETVAIPAGATIQEFTEKINAGGGNAYVKV